AQQHKGYRSVVVPSLPAVLGYAQQHFGRLSLERVMRPAIRLAEEGYPISRLQRRQLGWCLADLRASAATRELFLKRGRRYRVGETFRQERLAETLGRLADAGVQDFYHGEIARAIVEDMRAGGGLISDEDLSAHDAPVRCGPISTAYRGGLVLSTPPPAGGLQVCVGLRLMEELSRGQAPSDPDDICAMAAEVIRAVFHERERWSVHPRDVSPSLLRWLLSADRIGELSQRVTSAMNEPTPADLSPGDPGDSGETTHLCTADAEGNVVSLTQSIQSLFGAKVANARLGFLYNNYLRTCPRHRHPYALAGGCVPRSNASPTIVLSDGAPILALGAAGSRRIVSSVLQVVAGVFQQGLSCADALDAPRVHAQSPRTLHIERPAATEPLLRRLRARFPRQRMRARHSYFMGAVQAIHRLEAGWVGAADPRRGGTVAGVC
ncbi:hypothetical protein LCGC14_2290210, partial [marine sediment metagenome]